MIDESDLIDPHELSIANAPLPKVYESARLALSECSRIDECKDWANKAEALASYARQADDDTLLKTATRIKARAIRRCGELLKEIEPSKGGRPKKEEEEAWYDALNCTEDGTAYCIDCGAVFGDGIPHELLPIWHCPECDHHHGQDRRICNNCHEGERPELEKPVGASPQVSRSQAAAEAGLSKRQKDTAIRVANVPTDQEAEGFDALTRGARRL